MEPFYTGHEKKIHYTLTKRVIKRYGIKTDDIARIYFNCNRPTDSMPLWTVTVSIYKADRKDAVYSENFYTKDCIEYGFYITWANLKKGHF
jgi:hypothetical protein